MTIRRIQYSLVTAHGVLWSYCVFAAFQEPHDALWLMVWTPLAVADIPVTLGLQFLLLITPESLQVAVESWPPLAAATFPLSYAFGFWLPAVAYGTVGTLWWYFLPVMFGGMLRFLHLRKN